ncbi:MAG TPA: response regulator [Pyrinomonadaceae bacterium]
MGNGACYIILVVDDHHDNRELLNVFLQGLGYGVVEASNGLEALKVAGTNTPDLIIMDLSMPVMDGFNAVRILRQMPTTRKVPVVACTAQDDPTYKVQALNVGFNAILTKPIDFTRLRGVLTQYLKAA